MLAACCNDKKADGNGAINTGAAWKKIDRKEAIGYPNSQKLVALYFLKIILSVFDEEEYRQEKRFKM
jgi:hypothetical protein